ncbi:MAG: tRNA epoxyqueuosine(34) reductase QueG [Gammaproteobacteria bacterium]|nr:MAG: tRNA epoxyqueuosine(34) reductase QueG [Gammaproteobacteria bacterium]
MSLKQQIIRIAKNQGFNRVGFSKFNLSKQGEYFKKWLDRKHHGEMIYLENNIEKRINPSELFENLNSIICLQMDYASLPTDKDIYLLSQRQKAYISLYARGRDYHKLIRKKAQKIINEIQLSYPQSHNRVFVDSAPVLEKPLSVQAGLGWIGKNTLTINKKAGSFFFLAEIYTSLKLTPDEPYKKEYCQDCTSCIDMCPTNAIIAPFKVDARLCISYLSIEYKGIIPQNLRKKFGNRIFGCDDCQLYCPWNKFAINTCENDFKARHNFDNIDLLELFAYSEKEFKEKTAGSPIYRAGFVNWQRNIAIALGNSKPDLSTIKALESKKNNANSILSEHIDWALSQLSNKMEI